MCVTAFGLIRAMAKKITGLKLQKRNKNRVNVYLDGEFAFGLSRIVAAWLHTGQELSDEKIAELLSKDDVEIALQRALNFLSYRARSEKEVKQILSEAEKQAKSILNAAKKDAEAEAKEVLDRGKKQSENLNKILVSKANQDIKRDIMNAREEVIDECFSKARHKLSNLKGEDYEKLVRKLIADGQKKLGENCSVMVTRDADKKLAEELGIKIDGRIESSGGIILRSADRKVRLDYTVDGILKRDKNKIRIKVGRLLFS